MLGTQTALALSLADRGFPKLVVAYTYNSQSQNKNHYFALKYPNFIIEEVMGGKSGTKAVYFDKLKGLLDEYKSIFIVSVDNVSSQQMHEIRSSLRGDAVVLMGKNTMVRRAIKGFVADFPEYERLLPHVKGT